ncbi:site-specific integrase [Mitsuaria sp. 7]|uniref:site-specific integrase n=1 Tax=Mitsuaria sp. 7 TaxID=1658665 RepID=UPI000B26FC8C|nr:site-specific integrase [Mitsuaria sp. 7]
MSTLTGLFSRGPSFYLRVVLPLDHPGRSRYRSGRVVLSLGACSRREAISKGIMLRAEVLRGELPPTASAGHPTATGQLLPLPAASGNYATTLPPTAPPPAYLREVFGKWTEAKSRNKDTVAACKRALALFEQQTGNPPLAALSRAHGVEFRAWLQHPDRGTTTKTAHDRMTWVKSLLKFAHVDLELIHRQPWEGLDIDSSTTHRRRPWSTEELQTLLNAPLHAQYALPADIKSGGAAAYWVPLLGMFSGARISELIQLRRRDIELINGTLVLNITDDGDDLRLKTSAAVRKVPVHSELIRLGFGDYVNGIASPDLSMWPDVPRRDGKTGGYFSHWFGLHRRALGLGRYPDFHCFRHTVRSALANGEVAETLIDALLGHEAKGSTGARVYTHRALADLRTAIEKIEYPGVTASVAYLRHLLL